MILTRKNFIGGVRRRYKTIELPPGLELPDGTPTDGATVILQSLTEGELSAYEMRQISVAKSRDKMLVNEAALDAQRRSLLRLVIVGEDHSQLFAQDDDDFLCKLDGALSAHLFREAAKHCGLKELEETQTPKKNSETTHAAVAIGN